MALHRPARGLVHRAPLLAGLALILLVGLAIAATASANASSTANSFGRDIFGISTGGAIQGEDPTTLGRDLDAMQAAGSRWVRIDINWANVQAGGPSSYNWGPIDRVVQGASSRGMKVLGVILYTPSWARPPGTSGTYAPNPTQYAAFASTAAQHYSAMGVHAYEVWNEPNIPAFWTAPNPSAYTAVLKAAYPAIKGADPQATVLTGGTAPAATNGTSYAPVDWLQAIYANGGKGYFDAVATHPYCFGNNILPGDPLPSSPWYQIYGTNPSLRSVMLANGDGAKKIWGTEFGAPTNGPWNISESAQALMITTGYSLWSTYDWAGPLFTYEGRDLGTNTSDSENFFGLLHHDFSPKPAYPAYQAAASGVAPANTAPPTISGTAQDAQTLSASRGSWSGSPGGYAYQWRRCDTSGAGCTSISGATASSYRLVSGDVGATIRVIVTATNPAGSSSATSNQTAVVAAATTITVTGEGGKHQHPRAIGVVSTQSASGAGNSGAISGKVELKLYQRAGGSWQPVSQLETARLTARGRFEKPLRAFWAGTGTNRLDARSPAARQRPVQPGTYRLYARYPGSRSTEPSASRSPRFKVTR